MGRWPVLVALVEASSGSRRSWKILAHRRQRDHGAYAFCAARLYLSG